eukprot:158727_1
MCWPRKKLPTNQEGQSTRLWICHCQSIQIRVFHITWFTFFVCFFGWFATANLYVQISQDLGLSASDKAVAGGCMVASTVLFRVIFGYLCDAIGSKKSYVILLIMSAFPIAAMSIVTSSTGYIITSVFIGIAGASFVITQYHVMAHFAGKTVGTASATATGWGNFGGGMANFIMPILYSALKNNHNLTNSESWRLCMLIPAALLIMMAIIYGCFTEDRPPAIVNNSLSQHESEVESMPMNTNPKPDKSLSKISVATNSASSLKNRSGSDLKNKPNISDASAFKIGMSDYRTWILFVAYAACFGIELSVLTFTVDYFMNVFHVEQGLAGFIVLCFSFSNLFARSIGGIISDVVARFAEKSLQGRVISLFIVLLWEGIFLTAFSFAQFVSDNLVYPIIMLVLFSFGVQAAEGITFAIVPFVQPKAIGPVAGIVAAGGNVGAMLYAFVLFTNVPHNLEYWHAWEILGIFVIFTSFSILFIKFSDEEIRLADEKGASWTDLDNKHVEEKTGLSKYLPFI